MGDFASMFGADPGAAGAAGGAQAGDFLGNLFNTPSPAAAGAGAGADIGNLAGDMFGGGSPVTGALFGSPGAGTTPSTPSPSVPGITPPAPVPAPTAGAAAPTPASTQSAASAANPLPNPSPDTSAVTPAGAAAAESAGTGLAGSLTGLKENVVPTPTLPNMDHGGILGQLFGGGAPKINAGALKDILGAGALGIDLIHANQTPPGVKSLQQLAGTQAGLAKSWEAQAQGEAQGILPAGAQALVQNNLKASEAAIRGKYAQMGMSGSSAEVQDLQAARAQALAETFQIGQQMAQTGLAESSQATGAETQLLQAILAAETAQGTELGNALAGFAGAAAK